MGNFTSLRRKRQTAVAQTCWEGNTAQRRCRSPFLPKARSGLSTETDALNTLITASALDGVLAKVINLCAPHRALEKAIRRTSTKTMRLEELAVVGKNVIDEPVCFEEARIRARGAEWMRTRARSD